MPRDTPVPTFSDVTNIEPWELARVAGGQRGALPFISAWLLILGIVIFSAATGGIATVLLAIFILFILSIGTAWAAFDSLAGLSYTDPEFIGIAGILLAIAAALFAGPMVGVAVFVAAIVLMAAW
ncbi:hypothetical protein [Natronorubrum daqingense]|uniref:Uncharacterized protein n=1 Tax=Natronorubrum daqingense TaxID=588898 RepID=A0A1N7G6F8_9EURY|nr:hypothetical protein [Natronorubrum daqingense]APX98693.1 hypothetical protein BB347_18470 [Natronorubrum daqingense]SIS08138.1 hypothetical protein SAMN05421809_3767 [Natronorubrum daqingense]